MVGGGAGCLPSLSGGGETEYMTHTCENITFPQLRLRTVMKGSLASLSHWCILGAIGVFVGENDQRITYPPDRTLNLSMFYHYMKAFQTEL